MDFTEILPTEMMFEILNYVEPVDLNLFLVNKRFNAILSSSPRFLENYEISWKNIDQKDVEVLVNSTRRYSSIFISEVQEVPPQLIQVLQQNEIKFVCFEKCRFTASEFQQILEAIAEDVETISVAESEITDDVPLGEITQVKFECLSWLETSYNDNLKFMKHFLNSDCEHVNLENDIVHSEEDLEMIAKFLATQENLQVLYLSSDLAGIFRRRENVDALKFKLTSLHVEGMDFDQDDFDNFHAFMRKQQSLRVFAPLNMNLEFDSMRVVLNELASLKQIYFLGSLFQPTHDYLKLEKNVMIEQVSFQFVNEVLCENIQECIKLLPNLKKVRLHNFPRENLRSIMETLKTSALNLETMQFFHCRIPEIEMKQIKSLEFSRCKRKFVTKFLKINGHVKDVRFR